ncbi:unnamed protein product, partial [marine sediment metagenome]
ALQECKELRVIALGASGSLAKAWTDMVEYLRLR